MSQTTQSAGISGAKLNAFIRRCSTRLAIAGASRPDQSRRRGSDAPEAPGSSRPAPPRGRHRLPRGRNMAAKSQRFFELARRSRRSIFGFAKALSSARKQALGFHRSDSPTATRSADRKQTCSRWPPACCAASPSERTSIPTARSSVVRSDKGSQLGSTAGCHRQNREQDANDDRTFYPTAHRRGDRLGVRRKQCFDGKSLARKGQKHIAGRFWQNEPVPARAFQRSIGTAPALHLHRFRACRHSQSQSPTVTGDGKVAVLAGTSRRAGAGREKTERSAVAWSLDWRQHSRKRSRKEALAQTTASQKN